MDCILSAPVSDEKAEELFKAIIEFKNGDPRRKHVRIDPEERLKKIVLKTGEVNSGLRGFEIRVIYPYLFPWYQVINQREINDSGH